LLCLQWVQQALTKWLGRTRPLLIADIKLTRQPQSRVNRTSQVYQYRTWSPSNLHPSVRNGRYHRPVLSPLSIRCNTRCEQQWRTARSRWYKSLAKVFKRSRSSLGSSLVPSRCAVQGGDSSLNFVAWWPMECFVFWFWYYWSDKSIQSIRQSGSGVME